MTEGQERRLFTVDAAKSRKRNKALQEVNVWAKGRVSGRWEKGDWGSWLFEVWKRGVAKNQKTDLL